MLHKYNSETWSIHAPLIPFQPYHPIPLIYSPSTIRDDNGKKSMSDCGCHLSTSDPTIGDKEWFFDSTAADENPSYTTWKQSLKNRPIQIQFKPICRKFLPVLSRTSNSSSASDCVLRKNTLSQFPCWNIHEFPWLYQ